MFFRRDHGALRGGDHGDGIFLAKGFLDFPDRSGFSEGQARRVPGAEENVHKGKNGRDARSCFFAAPEVRAVVDIEGDQCPVLLEFFYAFDGKFLRPAAEPERDAAGVKQTRVVKHCLGNVRNGYTVDGGVFSVVDDAWFARVGAVLIIVDADAAVACGILDQISVADAGGVELVFDERREQVVWDL